MHGKKSRKSGSGEIMRQRIATLLDIRWGGRQRQMARDLGVTQGLISKIVHGQQGAGARFIAALTRQLGVNAEWVLRGEGPPLSLHQRGSLAVSQVILSGSPLENSHLLSGARHPVAEELDRGTRYWLEVQNSWLAQVDALRIRPGDLLMVETASETTMRLDFIEGRLCCVRLGGPSEPTFQIGLLLHDDRGLRLAKQESHAHGSQKKGFFRKPIKILDLQIEGETPEDTVFAAPPTPAPAEKRTSDNEVRADKTEEKASAAVPGSVALSDIVGVCIYLVRPM
jgi:plasmid maintenance system antidote protein VapI